MNPEENQQQYWQQQITAWQASELSGAAYCKEHSLTYHRFCYWRQKLISRQRTQVNSPSGFAKVVPPPSPAAAGELMISLPSGLSITGLHAGNVELLGAILRQL